MSGRQPEDALAAGFRAMAEAKREDEAAQGPDRTVAKWRAVEDYGYPQRHQYGPYPRVFVHMRTTGKHSDILRRTVVAELRFFGGDESRPFWAHADGQHAGAPMENSSWHVTHWAPLLADPEPSAAEHFAAECCPHKCSLSAESCPVSLGELGPVSPCDC